MNRSNTLRQVACALLAAASALPGQELDTSSTSRPQPSWFLDGWMKELLDGDPQSARKHYERAAAGKDLKNYQAEMALLRLREGHTDERIRSQYRSALADRGDYYVLELHSYRRTVTGLSRRMSAALKSKDQDEVVKIRAELRTFLARNKKFDPRAQMPQVVSKWRGEQARRKDPRLEELMELRRSALDQGNQRKARELWRSIRRRQFLITQEGSRRLIANRWSEMTRLHLNGEHARAIQMERYLESHGRRFYRAPDVQALIAKVERLNDAERKAKLTGEVIPNLQNWLTSGFAFADEKRVLSEVSKRLASHAAARQWKEGLLLAARLPYRALLIR